MPLLTFPKNITNLPIWTSGENANNAGQAGGNALGIIPCYNALLAEVQAIENLILDSPPSSVGPYDDEFNESAISSQWTLSSIPSNCSIGLVGPTWLGMTAFGSAATLTATETIVTAANFMFQFRCKFLGFMPITASSAPNAFCGLFTGSTRSFGLQIGFNPNGATWVPGITLVNGGSPIYSSTIHVLASSASISDIRIRIGEVSGNLICQISFDGATWLTIYSESFTGGGTSFNGNFPTSLQLGLAHAGSAIASSMVSWDYVRKIA